VGHRRLAAPGEDVEDQLVAGRAACQRFAHGSLNRFQAIGEHRREDPHEPAIRLVPGTEPSPYGIRFDDDDAFMIRTRDAANMRIGKLIERGITSFTYTYDFGDDWRHRIEIEEITPAIPGIDYPRFVDGERRAPPEDVGGTPGFEEFLNAMAKPRHPERASMVQWYGSVFDPTDISLDEINARTAKLAKRRAQGIAAYAGAKSRDS